ncbi:hypothetical protein H7E67_03820 [Clostridium gasigenes]|uniref:hypothetical protein n=1 Tax=Clostridium gasigenes TaxID=94869 RepID=UPI00162A228A|nr:hypothetical protein [Clostridium gasigenes]MBB6622550.1 hypothetical protein [Clostridium gasigenes]
MVKLKDISTRSLIEEIKLREGTRYIEIGENEVHKVQASGNDDSRNRYIKGRGPVVILEIADERK